MTRAVGLELALFDYEWASVHTIPGDGDPLSAEVRVAGAGALLVAKAHKVRDRLRDIESNPHRLRPKDSKDVALLMLSSDPTEVAENIERVVREHPETETIATDGFSFLAAEYHSHGTGGIVRDHAVSELYGAENAQARMDAWVEQFVGSTGLNIPTTRQRRLARHL